MVYRLSQFAKIVGYSLSGLRKLDESGKFKAKRTTTNQRYYDEGDVELFLKRKTSLPASNKDEKIFTAEDGEQIILVRKK